MFAFFQARSLSPYDRQWWPDSQEMGPSSGRIKKFYPLRRKFQNGIIFVTLCSQWLREEALSVIHMTKTHFRPQRSRLCKRSLLQKSAGSSSFKPSRQVLAPRLEIALKIDIKLLNNWNPKLLDMRAVPQTKKKWSSGKLAFSTKIQQSWVHFTSLSGVM